MSKWNPDDHLPECGVTRYPICICDRLRACEDRVEESMDRAFTHTLRLKQAEAFANGFYAARGRLDALIIDPPMSASDHTWNNGVRACIEALRGER